MRTILLALLVAMGPLPATAESPQFREGQALFAETCASCHGPTGRGGSGYAQPIWGHGAQLAKYGSALGLFEYQQMLMPFDDPTRVPDAAKWAVTLYLLANHGVIEKDATLGPENAGAIRIR